jgi:hypothetical protein
MFKQIIHKNGYPGVISYNQIASFGQITRLRGIEEARQEFKNVVRRASLIDAS